MTTKRSNMRLFNGHLKMDGASVRKIFLMQLSNIYSIKTYLVANLPLMAQAATFKDLEHAILETIDDIRLQLLRMDAIYDIINETYHHRQCVGVRALTMEAYVISKAPGMSKLETDLYMLYHLNMLESLEISCFTALHTLSLAMPNKDMALLIKQNLDMAKDNKELYEMISREYIN
jgi:ferritin-like metal-binding protein YciE